MQGAPVGRLLAAPAPGTLLVREDWAEGTAGESDSLLAARLAAHAAPPFDLAADPPLRGRLVRLGPEDHILLLVFHHMATDGASEAPFNRELGLAYAARRIGGKPHFPPLQVSYADHAAWQRKRTAPHEALATQIEYWRERLAGAPRLLTLPTDQPRDAGRERRAGTLTLTLDQEISRRLHALGRSQGATVFAVLLAAWTAFLGRLAGQEDVVVGAPTAGRDRDEVEPLVGCFVNTLPLRIDLSGRPDAPALVARAWAATQGALAHQDVPLGRLVDVLGAPRSASHTPIFQAMFAWQSQEVTPLALAGLRATRIPVPPTLAKYDLLLDLTPVGDGSIEGVIEYDASLFLAGTIIGWGAAFENLLRGMASGGPAEPVLAARPGGPENFVGATRAASGAGPSDLFEAQASRTPAGVAVREGDLELSYAELDEAANRLAHLLIARGVGPERVVGVALERSPDLVVAMLATMKSGGAYLPLDPAYPAERLALMMADEAALRGRSHHDCARRACLGTTPAMLALDAPEVMDALAGQPAGIPTDADRAAPVHPQHPAYVIYTSGSTGRPKGVAMTAGALVNLLAWQAAAAPLEAGARVLQFASPSFDVATQEILSTLQRRRDAGAWRARRRPAWIRPRCTPSSPTKRSAAPFCLR